MDLERVGAAMVASGNPAGVALVNAGRQQRSLAAQQVYQQQREQRLIQHDKTQALDRAAHESRLADAPHAVTGVDAAGNQVVNFPRPSGGASQTLTSKPATSLTMEKGLPMLGKNLNTAFSNDPTVKALSTYEPRLNQVSSYLKEMPQQGENSADDMALTKLYLSMTSGKGREYTREEMKQIEKFQSLPGHLIQGVQAIAKGKTLSDDVRKEMGGVIFGIAKNMAEQRNRKAADVLQRAPANSHQYIFGPAERARYGIPDAIAP